MQRQLRNLRQARPLLGGSNVRKSPLFCKIAQDRGVVFCRAILAQFDGGWRMPRRRSRPWLSLWESWRASGEPERAYAVTSLRIGAVIADGYPLSHGYHHLSNRVTPNGVGQLPGSQSRLSQRVQPALSVTAFSRASSPIGRAKGRASPAQPDHHPPSNRVTPNGVGHPPGSQARHSQRVQSALSVTAYAVPALP